MDWKRMAIAGLKRQRAAIVAKLQPELDKIDMLIGVFGEASQKPKSHKAKTRHGRPQAALDAIAVKRGTATVEQMERHNKRLSQKKGSVAGASLREAAAG